MAKLRGNKLGQEKKPNHGLPLTVLSYKEEVVGGTGFEPVTPAV